MQECPWTYTTWPQTLFLFFATINFLRARELSPDHPAAFGLVQIPRDLLYNVTRLVILNFQALGFSPVSRLSLIPLVARLVDRPHWPRVCNRLKLDYTDVFTCDSQFLTTNVHSIIPAGSPQNTVFTTSIVLLSLVLKITCEKNKPVSSRSSSFSWLWRSIISRIKKRIFIQYNTRLYSRDKKKIKL